MARTGCQEEYVKENDRGTIVTVLSVTEELAVIPKVLEDGSPETVDTWIDW